MSHTGVLSVALPTLVPMDQTLAAVVIVALLALAAAVGVVWRQGNSRVSTEVHPDQVPARFRSPDATLTMLQISAPLCSYCGAMRGILGDIAQAEPRAAHVEWDVSDATELVDRFGIRQTPTTLLVSASGDVISRLQGATPAVVVKTQVADAFTEIQRRADEYRI